MKKICCEVFFSSYSQEMNDALRWFIIISIMLVTSLFCFHYFTFRYFLKFSQLLSCTCHLQNVNEKKIRMFYFDVQIVRDDRRVTQLFTVNQFLVEMFERIFSFSQFSTVYKEIHRSGITNWINPLVPFNGHQALKD